MSTLSLQQQVGLAIRFFRERMKVSQESFADSIGMHRAYYGGVERGYKNLTLRNIERIANGLGVSAAALFSKANEMK